MTPFIGGLSPIRTARLCSGRNPLGWGIAGKFLEAPENVKLSRVFEDLQISTPHLAQSAGMASRS
jgi:hypothetical protein